MRLQISYALIICLFLYKSDCWEISKKYPDLYYRDCMVVPENNYSTMVMKPIKSKCPTVDCWKSQLTVPSKANLTWICNTFRNELAQKNSKNGMVKVNWHWMLEVEAMKILQNCPDEGAAVIETRNVGGLDYHMSCEESILTIPKNFQTQTDFVNYFPELLHGQQIEKGEYFKLPSVSHFGCAVIFPQNSARLVCLYCAKANLLSSDSTCPHQYEKDKNSEFPNLCAHEFRKSLYGCEPRTLSAYCIKPEPVYRKQQFDGSVRYMYAVTDDDNFLIYINGTGAESGSVKHMVLGCQEQGGQCAPPLSAWSYLYEPLKMLQLNKTVFFYNNKTFIRYGTNNVYTQMAPVTERYPEKASCCSTILIFFLLTSIPVGIIMYFTYLHRKQHPE